MRIYLIDHHTLFRKGFRLLLESEGFTVLGDCSSVDEALLEDFEGAVDIIMVEIDALNGSVDDDLSRLIEAHPSTPVLFLSCQCEPEIVRDVLESGAKGYLLKRVTTTELHRALKTVANGGHYYHQDVTAQAFESLHGAWMAPTEGLSEQDQRILELVAEGFNNSRIAEEVFVSTSTVKNRLRKLFERFEVADRTQLVMQAIKAGILQIDLEQPEAPQTLPQSAK